MLTESLLATRGQLTLPFVLMLVAVVILLPVVITLYFRNRDRD